MQTSNPFGAVGRSIGLRILCETTHLEPRYTIGLQQDEEGPCLRIQLRNDQSIAVCLVDHVTDPPAVLIEVQEETVQREPVLNLWLPYSARHLHLVHRRDQSWVVATLPEMCSAASVAEARELLARQDELQDD